MNLSEIAKKHADSCRFCWMCRHVCPIGNATGLERNTARARALGVSVVARGAEKINDIIDNIFECSLCGACTNNCMTGWDPKIFIQEVKADAILNGVVPSYIKTLLDKYFEFGNVYGLSCSDVVKKYFNNGSDTLLVMGQDAIYKSENCVKGVFDLFNKLSINVSFDEKSNDTGSALWFLTGNTKETQDASKKCANLLNKFKTVIIYDPVDLAFIKHQYKEWGIALNTKIVGFNEFVLDLLESGTLKIKKSNKIYSVQDNYAYSRDLDDSDTVRKILEKCGNLKEMLLIKKEANMAGNLIMNEYMPDVQKKVAENRWLNAVNMECKNLVVANPAEYEMLNKTCPDGYTVLTVEQAVLENI